ncbi:MAG: hypothetical protein NTX48_06730, partial [Planctomycetales bacterium]|nr:hypothetical protein [Planctomycetales bacterium]
SCAGTAFHERVARVGNFFLRVYDNFLLKNTGIRCGFLFECGFKFGLNGSEPMRHHKTLRLSSVTTDPTHAEMRKAALDLESTAASLDFYADRMTLEA